MKSKLLPALVTALGMAAAGNASAIIVGGIDFGTTGTTVHLETTTVAETIVSASGDLLQGYGQVNTVNGDSTYCAVDANCRLFFYFTYTTQTFTGATASFTGGTISVFYDPGTGGANTGATRNLLDFSSPQNVAYITSLATSWVTLTGHNFQSSVCGITQLCAVAIGTNVNLGFVGSGLADVSLGGPGIAAVKAFWNGNSEADGLGGFADIQITTSGATSVINSHDTCTGQTGQWCIQGSADIRGSTVVVPEPATLLLLGIGLVGVGFGASRRKNVA